MRLIERMAKTRRAARSVSRHRVSRRMRGGEGDWSHWESPENHYKRQANAHKRQANAQTLRNGCLTTKRTKRSEFKDIGQKSRGLGEPCSQSTLGNDNCKNPLKCQYVRDIELDVTEYQCRPRGTTKQSLTNTILGEKTFSVVGDC